jgi:hypothetical protein
MKVAAGILFIQTRVVSRQRHDRACACRRRCLSVHRVNHAEADPSETEFPLRLAKLRDGKLDLLARMRC